MCVLFTFHLPTSVICSLSPSVLSLFYHSFLSLSLSLSFFFWWNWPSLFDLSTSYPFTLQGFARAVRHPKGVWFAWMNIKISAQQLLKMQPIHYVTRTISLSLPLYLFYKIQGWVTLVDFEVMKRMREREREKKKACISGLHNLHLTKGEWLNGVSFFSFFFDKDS